MSHMDTPRPTPSAPLFTPPAARHDGVSIVPWVVAGGIVLLLAGVILFLTHHAPHAAQNSLLPADPYAANLNFSALKMSESTSLSGGKSLFIDGRVHNAGSKTLTSANLQVVFPADAPPQQIESVPLTLIRTHDPYVDIEPVAADPIAPGQDREFRLIFEDIRPSWNQQLPEIHLASVVTR